MTALSSKQNKVLRRMAMLATAAGLAWSVAAQAQTQPFGQGFDGWSFTATKEKSGVVNCRATRKAGGREDILAYRNDNHTYISVKAEGRKGKWPKTIVRIPGKPPGQMEWKVDAGADGGRMWFIVDSSAISEIAAVGRFEWSLTDTEDSAIVNLGKRTADAWERVNQCFVKNT